MSTKLDLYMNKQTDFKINGFYKVADPKPNEHHFKIGSKVKIIGHSTKEDMVGPDLLSCGQWKKDGDGKDFFLEQWLKPDQLVKPKSSWRKELLRADGAVYLVRYTLLRLPFLRIRLHHILLSDTECCHDHPWSFISIILRGKYKEIRQWPENYFKMSGLNMLKYISMGITYNEQTDKFTSEQWHGAGSILIRKATDIHRLELDSIDLGNGHHVPKPCWTLVIMGRYKRPDWGFWKKNAFVHNEKYEYAQKCDE